MLFCAHHCKYLRQQLCHFQKYGALKPSMDEHQESVVAFLFTLWCYIGNKGVIPLLHVYYAASVQKAASYYMRKKWCNCICMKAKGKLFHFSAVLCLIRTVPEMTIRFVGRKTSVRGRRGKNIFFEIGR